MGRCRESEKPWRGGGERQRVGSGGELFSGPSRGHRLGTDGCCPCRSAEVLGGRVGEAPTYVNVPTSPCPAKQLHYLGLQLPEAGAARASGCAGEADARRSRGLGAGDLRGQGLWGAGDPGLWGSGGQGSRSPEGSWGTGGLGVWGLGGPGGPGFWGSRGLGSGVQKA